jgi:hypothetical protein
LDREGVVIQESKAASTPEAISDEFHARSGARAGRGAGRGTLKLKNWAFAINDAQRADRTGLSACDNHARNAARWNGRTEFEPA